MSSQLMPLPIFRLPCNAVAETTLLSWSETVQCVNTFETLTVLLNPDLTMPEHEQLSAAERARVSVES